MEHRLPIISVEVRVAALVELLRHPRASEGDGEDVPPTHVAVVAKGDLEACDERVLGASERRGRGSEERLSQRFVALLLARPSPPCLTFYNDELPAIARHDRVTLDGGHLRRDEGAIEVLSRVRACRGDMHERRAK